MLARIGDILLSCSRANFSFAAGLSVLTAALFGLVPALEASRVPLAGALHDGGRSATQGPRVRRLRQLLVAGEVAAALVLLAGAALVGKSLLRVLALETGFDPQGLVSLRVSLDHATYETGEQSRQFYRALLPRLAGLPGAADRFLAALLMGLAGLALVLAATGLHGLLAYLVGQRTQELGLRQALGATPAQVIGLVMGESLRLVLAGCGMGLLLALALLPQVSALLYEVGPSDVWAWAGAIGLLLTTAIVATLVPARAAARVDPLSALRAE